MAQDVGAIDFMYYVATPEFIAKWSDAKKGELICRMERAIGGGLTWLDNARRLFIACCPYPLVGLAPGRAA